jgi:hypothetical protein
MQNIQITLVVLAEIIPGVAIPGRPYANMIVSQAVARDTSKLGVRD